MKFTKDNITIEAIEIDKDKSNAWIEKNKYETKDGRIFEPTPFQIQELNSNEVFNLFDVGAFNKNLIKSDERLVILRAERQKYYIMKIVK